MDSTTQLALLESCLFVYSFTHRSALVRVIMCRFVGTLQGVRPNPYGTGWEYASSKEVDLEIFVIFLVEIMKMFH